MSKEKLIIMKITGLVIMSTVKCTIDGLSYMDPINMRPLPGQYRKGEDPCNPLYWYPRNIPEYCNYRNFPIPSKPAAPPLPMPLPVPVPPPPPPIAMPVPPPPPPIAMPMPAPPVPVLPPLPYGVPIAPTNPMLPIAAPVLVSSYPYGSSIYPPAPPPYPLPPNPYPSSLQQSGMVPGLPGLVTKDGGINILPFSDAYSDLLENHKNQMIRKRLQKLIREYEDFPNARSYRRLKKYARRNMYE